MDFNRLVIDTIKDSFSEFVATGEVDSQPLKNVLLQLSLEIDKREVERLPTDELKDLREDILWVKNDLLEL